MRNFIAAVSAACLLATTAMAETTTVGPLPPGKPAGVKKADMEDPLLFVLGGLAVIAIICVAATSGGNGPTTTSPAAPSGTA